MYIRDFLPSLPCLTHYYIYIVIFNLIKSPIFVIIIICNNLENVYNIYYKILQTIYIIYERFGRRIFYYIKS